MLKRAGFLIVGLVCLLVITPAVAPVQLSYVYSGSMEPTIEQFDGYVLIRTADANVGDIVTFWSSERDTYVTHRITGRSNQGFITKGDANPTTDQAAGSPYVDREDIRGRVLTLRGSPVLVPGLGEFARFVRTHRAPIAGLLGSALLAALLRGRTASRPSRSVPRVRDVLWPVFVVAVISAIGLQFAGAQTKQMTYVALSSETDGPNRLTVGEAGTDSFTINRSELPMTAYVVSADRMTITNQTRNDSTITVSVRIPPPTHTGVVTTTVTVNRYVTVLPMGIIRRLHGIHPFLAGATTVGVTMLPLVVLVTLAIDGKQPIRSVESSSMRMLKRRWREL